MNRKKRQRKLKARTARKIDAAKAVKKPAPAPAPSKKK